MRPNLAFCLAALVTHLSAGEPVVWRLDQTARIGGQTTEVLGAPRVATEAGIPAVWFNGTSDGLLVPVNPLAGLAQFHDRGPVLARRRRPGRTTLPPCAGRTRRPRPH
jgi:hypothetical protein